MIFQLRRQLFDLLRLLLPVLVLDGRRLDALDLRDESIDSLLLLVNLRLRVFRDLLLPRNHALVEEHADFFHRFFDFFELLGEVRLNHGKRTFQGVLLRLEKLSLRFFSRFFRRFFVFVFAVFTGNVRRRLITFRFFCLKFRSLIGSSRPRFSCKIAMLEFISRALCNFLFRSVGDGFPVVSTLFKKFTDCLRKLAYESDDLLDWF